MSTSNVPGGYPPTPATGKPRGRGLIRSGVICMVLAVLIGALAVFLAIRPVFDAAPERIIGDTTVRVEDGGSYAIYVLGNVSGADASGCQVAGPAGDVPLRSPIGTQTITTNGLTYTLLRVFDTTPGSYVVSCAESSVQYAVGPEVNVFRTVGLGFIGIFGGIALFLLGLVLLIVGVVRKGRQDPGPPPYPGQSHPGQPYPGQPQPGQPYPGQPPSGQPPSGQQFPGQPQPGQPYPGQPQPGQPYPGQPPPGW